MSDDISLENVSQEDFDAAEATLIDLIRSEYPHLDLRRGTVLRDILIRPAASVYALNTDRLEDLRGKMSLQTLSTDPDADPADIDAILSNFNVTRNSGTVSQGKILVRVDASRSYTISSGFAFSTVEGLTFVTPQTYQVGPDADTLYGEIPLTQSNDGSYYYFIIDVVAEDVGSQYNITHGTALDVVGTMYGFVSAEAYSTFRDGLDEEGIQAVIARLPAAISYRALESRTSIDAKLRDQFDGTDVRIQEISVQGYGDRTQLRDKHNPMGFAVGGRVDICARTFVEPAVVTLRKNATLVNGVYQFTIDVDDAPGFYGIKSISEVEEILTPSLLFNALPVLGSYDWVEVRAAEGIANTFHDIDPDNSMIEVSRTVFQVATVSVSGVPATGNTHEFKVEVYVAPGLTDIQTYVDSTVVRNLESDYIVRCPNICLIGIDVKAYHDINDTIDVEQMQRDLHSYINTRSFVRRLTRSQLSTILHEDGAKRVDLGSTGMLLQGVVLDATGVRHTLYGDSLDLETIAVPNALLAPETTVFAAEITDIHIEAVAE